MRRRCRARRRQLSASRSPSRCEWRRNQRALQLRARELAQGKFAATAAETDRTEQYPWANVELLRDAGFMGMTLPTRVGGQGRSYHGSSGCGRDHPLERHVRDARMFTIAGGTTQILRTQLASTLLGMKLPQTRDGYAAADRQRR